MTARMPIVGGNWKMNTLLATGVELAEDIAAGSADLVEHCIIVVFPPFPYLQAVGRALGHHRIILGGQDLSPEPEGAFTGEVSAGMLLDLNVGMILAGHSERRHVIGEDDELVAAKVAAALAAGLHVTLCIGERREEREAGRTGEVNVRQLKRGLQGVDAEAMRRVVIAYEPVWAIGTGLAATARDAQEVHVLIRDTLGEQFGPDIAAATRIQYGGSVKPGNATELISEPDIDGFLVGGASLNADDFLAIVRAARDARSKPAGRPRREARHA